jgi:GC-rich sequence DNA-binding factor
MSFRARRATGNANAKATKAGVDDEDDALKPPTTTTTTTTAGASGTGTKAKKKGIKPAASLLSFEDDDGGEGEDDGGLGRSLLKTKKKSSRDKGATKARFAANIALPTPSIVAAGSETRSYDLESLKALASAQRTVKDRPEEHREAAAGTSGAAVAGRSVGDVFGRSGEWLPPPPPREDALSGIPDAKTIAAAKVKREAARLQASGKPAADFIDLDSGREHRNERVAFKAVHGGVSDRMLGVYTEGDILAGSDGEDADEFERAQFSRVFKDEPDMKRTVAQVKSSAGGGKTSSVSIDQDGIDALASLRRALAMAEASSANATSEAARADDHAVKSKEALEFYEKELKGASERYVYTQKLRDYFRDACAMLHHKMPIVEELEAHYRKFHALRAKALTEAINVEREEAEIEATAATEAVNAVFANGGTHAEATAAAAAAVEDAVFKVKNLQAKNLDEMGRDLNIAMRGAANARSKRRQASLSTAVAEDERQVSLFHKDWTDARQAADAILCDASEEFSTVSAVKKRAEEWKRTHPSSYKNTYMSISAPSLFAPFVRIELIGWSPLYPRQGSSIPTGLDSMKWHGDLFDYGLADGAGADSRDEDGNLLPNIVQHVILPIVSEAVEEWWDPRDATQTRALAASLKDVFVYVDPATNEEAKEVEIAVHRKLKRCAEEDCVVPTYLPVVAQCAPDAKRHAAIRFQTSLDVIRGALELDGVLDRVTLQRIICDVIVAKHIVPYVRLQLVDPSGCAATMRALVDVLPNNWTRTAPQGILPLRDIAQSLQQIASASSNADTTMAADATHVLARLLP